MFRLLAFVCAACVWNGVRLCSDCRGICAAASKEQWLQSTAEQITKETAFAYRRLLLPPLLHICCICQDRPTTSTRAKIQIECRCVNGCSSSPHPDLSHPTPRVEAKRASRIVRLTLAAAAWRESSSPPLVSLFHFSSLMDRRHWHRPVNYTSLLHRVIAPAYYTSLLHHVIGLLLPLIKLLH